MGGKCLAAESARLLSCAEQRRIKANGSLDFAIQCAKCDASKLKFFLQSYTCELPSSLRVAKDPNCDSVDASGQCTSCTAVNGQPAYFLSPGAAVSCVQVCASTVYDVEFELVPFVPLKTFDPTAQ